VAEERLQAAEWVLLKAIDLAPEYAPAHRDLGVIRARRGNESGARKAYWQYLKLAPRAPDAADVRRILQQKTP
jgi:Flp pilus assembly protein TadD